MTAEIVDSHVHLLPGRLATKVRAFFEEHITQGRLLYPLDHATVLTTLHRLGIGMVWSLPYAHKAGVAAGLNAASAATRLEFADGPVQVVGGATVHPLDNDPAAIVRQALDVYGLPVLKLHCSVGEYSPADPALSPVWELVSQRQMPVIVHVGHAITGHTDGGELAPLERVAQAWPEALIIIAHSAHPAGAAALDLVEKYPQVYADLTPVVFEPVALPTERVKHLYSKLLFGSDAPNVGIKIEDLIAHVGDYGLNEEQQAAIMGGNARRLLAAVRI